MNALDDPMPETPDPKIRSHPYRTDAAPLPFPTDAGTPTSTRSTIPYAELHVRSNFTFLTGASHPEELVEQSARLGHTAAAITDVNTLAGVVRAHVAAKQIGIPLAIGAELVFGLDPTLCNSATPPLRRFSLLAFPTDRPSYARLSRLLTRGKRRAPKGECHLVLDDLIDYQEGLLAVVLPPATIDEASVDIIENLRRVFDDDRLSIAATRGFGANDAARLAEIAALCTHTRVPMAATNAVLYHAPERRELQDVLTCIRLGCTIEEAGTSLQANAERHLKDPREMARLFAEHPQAVARAAAVAKRASAFSLDEIKYQYPHEVCPPGKTPQQYLEELVWQGAAQLGSDEATERRSDEVEGGGGSSDVARTSTTKETGNGSDQEFSGNGSDPDRADPRNGPRAPGTHPGLGEQGRLNRRPACDSKHSATPPSPSSLRRSVASSLRHELQIIKDLQYASYFLTVHDIVRFARGRGILCQGRGAAANSVVCYCLGITSVDPTKIDLLFERFVSKERNEPPDIDIDFEHERREEVIQYIYSKYGRHRAALTAEVITYRSRSAVRDVGKAMGLSLDAVDRLAKSLDWWDRGAVRTARLRELGLNPDDPTLLRVIHLTGELLGFPRHLSQHVGGFVITQDPLSDLVPIENAAMEDRTVIEWDKDDIDAMGFLKVDCLGLGMLTCIRRAFDFVASPEGATDPSPGRKPWVNSSPAPGGGGGRVREAGGGAVRSDQQRPLRQARKASLDTSPAGGGGGAKRCGARTIEPLVAQRTLSKSDLVAISHSSVPLCQPPRPLCSFSDASDCHTTPASTRLQLSTVPPEDPAVYDMICHADTIGVFQIESRAQMSMLPRLRPQNFYDLVIEVAIVRPGPIQGDMVHPYLRRRNKEEKEEYPSDAVRAVLGRTLGVPLFQEQAMKLAIVAAGFSPGEADQLRRAMAAWKRKGDRLLAFEERFIGGMLKNGYKRDFAERCFNQLKGFSEYGFPESHAASFALLVYVSAWLKRHHPAAFAAALINSQPMGFYAPAQIVRDAQEHGVEVRGVDVNASGWECSLENDEVSKSSPALRLGMRLVKGLSESEAKLIENAVRERGPFRDIDTLHRASAVKAASLRKLAQADAFQSMGLDRQHALWAVRGLRDEELALFEQGLGGKWAEGQSDEGQVGYSPLPPCPFAPSPLLLPHIPAPTRVVHDYAATGLSLKAHPVSFMRARLDQRRVTPNVRLRDESACPTGRHVRVAGIVLVRQRPATASGVVFFTIEDETGIANLIVRPHIYDRYRRDARHSVIIMAEGKVERQGEVVHVLVSSITRLDDDLTELTAKSRDFH